MKKIQGKIEDSKYIDHNSFVSYYESYFPLLYLHALRMLDDREEAKDVVQEVFFKIWDKRNEISIKESVKSYLYKSTRNAVLDKIASRKISEKHKENMKSFSTKTVEIEDEAQIARNLSASIDAEIDKLPPQMRLIFQLSRIEEQSHKEIASQLNISANTVKTQIARALKALKLKITYFF